MPVVCVSSNSCVFFFLCCTAELEKCDFLSVNKQLDCIHWIRSENKVLLDFIASECLSPRINSHAQIIHSQGFTLSFAMHHFCFCYCCCCLDTRDRISAHTFDIV